MCGIVGLLSKSKTGFTLSAQELFTNMLCMDSVRGPDSTGVFGVTKYGSKVDVMKGDTDGYTFVRSKNYRWFYKKIWDDYIAVIGHNRKATRGTISAKNAHPFKVEHITLVHNGTLTDTSELSDADVEVDSEAIAHALAKNDPTTALNKIQGAYAIVWYDKNKETLNLARNKERPLSLIETNDFWVISSEIGLPNWLLTRENRAVVTTKSVPLTKILSFDLKNLDKVPTEHDYDEYVKWSPMRTSVHVTPKPDSAQFSNYPPNLGHVNNILALQERIKGMGYKPGDIVYFKAYDYKDKPSGEFKLLGHPKVLENIIEDITVQSILPKGELVEDWLTKGEYFKGTLMQARPIMGTIVWFVKDLQVYNVVQDSQGREHDSEVLKEILKRGCGRCQGSMYLDMVKDSIVQPKSNGDWRLLCSVCISQSIADAKRQRDENAKKSINVH